LAALTAALWPKYRSKVGRAEGSRFMTAEVVVHGFIEKVKVRRSTRIAANRLLKG